MKTRSRSLFLSFENSDNKSSRVQKYLYMNQVGAVSRKKSLSWARQLFPIQFHVYITSFRFFDFSHSSTRSEFLLSTSLSSISFGYTNRRLSTIDFSSIPDAIRWSSTWNFVDTQKNCREIFFFCEKLKGKFFSDPFVCWKNWKKKENWCKNRVRNFLPMTKTIFYNFFEWNCHWLSEEKSEEKNEEKKSENLLKIILWFLRSTSSRINWVSGKKRNWREVNFLLTRQSENISWNFNEEKRNKISTLRLNFDLFSDIIN